jgi:glutamate/tyrosine decarboxylase-like PLP-dependent enzyme
VTHPRDAGDDTLTVLSSVLKEAENYLAEIDDDVATPGGEKALTAFDEPLPEEGIGAADSIRRLIEDGLPAHTRSSGPRFFHFVTGGVTPAAMGADWLTSLIDQNPGMWIGSPLAARLEQVALGWLRELFGLPAEWGGKLVSGATMANYTALAAARRWWALQHGIDVDEHGLTGLPRVPVFSSGYVHASSVKALGMVGIGRSTVQTLAADATGRLDLGALDDALRGAGPSIIIANAAEVNAGDFDPISDMADLAQEHGAWLHIDGAFGLFAAASPKSAHLVKGVDRADSVTADGHKWLNVPYDNGFVFVRDQSLLGEIFSIKAAYLAPTDPSRPNLGFQGPESSQRARAFTIWATLAAYGREGYRKIVERHLELAKRTGAAVKAAPDLELLADVKLNIICFRYNPGGKSEDELDQINADAGQMLIEDGRVYAGTTKYAGRTAFRPAIVNWRTTEKDVDLLVDVAREMGARAAAR